MTAAYEQEPTFASADPFAVSHTMYRELVEMASTKDALGAGHEVVERAIVHQGQALLRQLYQDDLDLRTVHEQQVEVVSEDGVRRGERRRGSRTLRSLLGPVVWTRYVYQEPANDSRPPADAGLELPEDGFSRVDIQPGGGVKPRAPEPSSAPSARA